jgi:hypothetical protein
MTQALSNIATTFAPGGPLLAGEIFEDATLAVMARIRQTDGSLIVQSDISALTLTVRRRADLALVVDGASLTVAAIVFNALQQGDAAWEEANPGDNEGYNFRHDMAGATYFATPGFYDVQWKFAESGGDGYILSGTVNVKNTINT